MSKKVKAPEYLIYHHHHMVCCGQVSKEQSFDLLYSDDFNSDSFDTVMFELPEYVTLHLAEDQVPF